MDSALREDMVVEKGGRGPEAEPTEGQLIVLYGVNNLGKSTQVDLLVDALSEAGVDVVRRKSPNYESLSGKQINAILREGKEASSEELQLWQAVNMHQDQRFISENIENGRVVISEDYWGTTLAWGLGCGVSREELDAMTDGLRPPDITVLLHGERFLDSTEKGHRHEENDDLTDRVQQHHLELAEEFGWNKVSANQAIDDVHKEIMAIVQGNLVG